MCIRDRVEVITVKDAVREFVKKSAASAASLDYVKFQAVIKSAASAALPKAKSREGSSRGAPDDGARWDDGGGRTTDRFGRRNGALPWSSLPLISPLGRLR